MPSTDRQFTRFQDELEELKKRLLVMGGLAEELVRLAVKGLTDRDPSLISQVVKGDQPINDLHIEIDDRCFKLLALKQPMAIDLRAIVAAFKINTDLERVGDLAINLVEATKRYMLHPSIKPLVDIPKMAEISQQMLRDALDAYIHRNEQLAQRVLEKDDKLDNLRSRVFRDLLEFMTKKHETIEPALELILVSRHLERIGDHATNIAEDVIFIVSARDVRHHSGDLASHSTHQA